VAVVRRQRRRRCRGSSLGVATSDDVGRTRKGSLSWALLVAPQRNEEKKNGPTVTVSYICTPTNTSSPSALTLSCQNSYVSKMTYKHNKLGRTDLIFGFIIIIITGIFRVA